MSEKKERKKPEKQYYRYDKVIEVVRKAKIPLNKTSLREFCVGFTIAYFTDEEGNINLAGLVKTIRESRDKEIVEDLGTLKLD